MTSSRVVQIPSGGETLEGALEIPEGAGGIVAFAHGSGSGRHSPRNLAVAGVLQRAGLATLLVDLLTQREEAADLRTGHLRFDIPFLARRVSQVTAWLREEPQVGAMHLGYFGSSTGAAAALVAAAEQPEAVRAVVSRGGRPDLARDALARVRAPTLLIVGGEDVDVLDLNRHALARLRCEKDLIVIPGATHLFEEPGALDQVADHAAKWYERFLA